MTKKMYYVSELDKVINKLLTTPSGESHPYFIDSWFICERCHGGGYFYTNKESDLPTSTCEVCSGSGKVQISIQVNRL